MKITSRFRNVQKIPKHLTHVKELAERKYYQDQFAENSRNSKQTWTLTINIFGKHKPSSFPQRLNVD